jgi:hypothetical protein
MRRNTTAGTAGRKAGQMYKLTTRTEDLDALRAFMAGKKDKREALMTLHIAPDYIEATDGRGMLRISRGDLITTDAPAGVYTISATRKIGGGMSEAILEAYDAEYPNTDRVIPARVNSASQVAGIIISDDDMVITRAVINLFKHTGNAYAYGLIAKLAGIAGTWAVDKAGIDKPARMDYTDCAGVAYIAVVMPFKMAD